MFITNIRFHRQAFIVYNNGENLKILIEIFRQKLIVSNIILAFIDHLKTKIFFVDQSWWPTQSAPLFKISGSAPVLKETHTSTFIVKVNIDIYREGYWLHLSKLQSCLCPIKLFRKQIKTAKIKESEKHFIFRQIFHSNRGFKLSYLVGFRFAKRYFFKNCGYSFIKNVIIYRYLPFIF